MSRLFAALVGELDSPHVDPRPSARVRAVLRLLADEGAITAGDVTRLLGYCKASVSILERLRRYHLADLDGPGRYRVTALGAILAAELNDE